MKSKQAWTSAWAMAAMLLVGTPGRAQDAVGTWTGETSGAGGLAVRPITMVLNADGTGSMEVDVTLELEDLMIDGSSIAFSVRPMILGNPAGFRFHYEGEIEGDSMILYVTMRRDGGGVTGGGEDPEPLVLMRKSP